MIADPSIVRLADPHDEDAVVAMCRLHHAEIALRDGTGAPFPFSDERVRAMVQRACIRNRNHPDAGQSFCGVIGAHGSLEAAIYLTQEVMWYSDRPILREVFCIVAPEHRKSMHARSLTAFGKIIAACLEKTLVGEVSGQRIEAKERFYARNYGAERVGSFYAFDPMPGA